MSAKPTYTELEQRVAELEAQLARLEHAGAALQRQYSRHRKAAEMALLGHWELDLGDQRLCWSDEIYNIFDLDPREFGATYEAFLAAVHPSDRDWVDRAYKESLRDRVGYDIVHRLKLRDGTIKYVREKCKTDYDDDGAPLRSLGTVQDITEEMRRKHGFAGIISRDPRMHELFQTIRDLADVNAPVLVQGESGTGKELVAAAIHSSGRSGRGALRRGQLRALPEELLESELFGHVRGAFTGAVRDKKGRFELAHGGTLFLDEVGDLPQLSRSSCCACCRRGPSSAWAASGRSPSTCAWSAPPTAICARRWTRGGFREDLFYRLKVVPINLPPLRERNERHPAAGGAPARAGRAGGAARGGALRRRPGGADGLRLARATSASCRARCASR